MAVPHLPAIAIDQSSAEKASRTAEELDQSPKKPKFVSFSDVRLGSILRQPQPGDPYLSPRFSGKPRPLGLIPGKNDRLTALKRLNQLLSPWKPEPTILSRPTRGTILPEINSISNQQGILSAASTSSNSTLPLVVIHNRRVNTVEVSRHHEEASYRRQLFLAQEASLLQSSAREADPDYMEVTDKAIMRYCDTPHQPPPSNHGRSLTCTEKGPQVHVRESKAQNKKKALWKRYSDPGKSSLQYIGFTGQVHLNHRSLMDDRREAAEYELCERCRLRGTRCARCLALRTGGGYIIIGCEENALDYRRRGKDGSGVAWQLAQSNLSGQERRKRRARKGGLGDGEGGRSGEMSGDGSSDNVGDGSEGRRGGGGGGLQRTREGMDNEAWKLRERDTGDSQQHDRSSLQSGKKGWHGKQHGDGQGGDTDRHSSDRESGHGSERGRGGDGGGSDGWDDSGRQSQGGGSRSGSRLLSARSRPGSTRGARPGSSIKRYGRSLERRGRASTNQERMSGRGQRKGESDSDDDGEGARGRRRGQGEGSDDDMEDRDRSGLDYQLEGAEEEERSKQGYRGNLLKYKRKKDDVKVLHATMKELQGIDPLDYLARYCIIDQSKLPHYQHVFENVDRDEDDEISVSELDFALKAVNYDLITDAEMNYVHSVLELAGRYRLNFQLFSLVAALSEKVVSLEDMVKRLINNMDFHALEVKMKKCKELFYLLADSDSIHEGGVVTTASLGVELQAGGLTQEHVEYVVDRLNHEDRGLVEFLDYLTYVPLFVEIHDAIYGNPLDFSRTK